MSNTYTELSDFGTESDIDRIKKRISELEHELANLRKDLSMYEWMSS